MSAIQWSRNFVVEYRRPFGIGHSSGHKPDGSDWSQTTSRRRTGSAYFMDAACPWLCGDTARRSKVSWIARWHQNYDISSIALPKATEPTWRDERSSEISAKRTKQNIGNGNLQSVKNGK